MIGTPASRRVVVLIVASAAVIALTAATAMRGERRPAAERPLTAVPADTTVPVCRPAEEGGEATARVEAAEAEGIIARGEGYLGPCARYGPPAAIGGGTIRTYLQLDGSRPWAIGVEVPARLFPGLPPEPHDGFRCLDVDEDGEVDLAHECVGGHERVLQLPAGHEEAGTPFRWVLFNWNPTGHGPPGVFTVPHFDFHFFIQSLSERNSIRIGKCALLVNCDDLAVGTAPVPGDYLPPGYENRGVVEFWGGNHLVDTASPVESGAPFTHVFTYGAWGGEISFYEPMVARSWMESLSAQPEPALCEPIRQPGAWREAGYYPTRYCIRFRPGREEYAVSLEGFVRRPAG